MSAAPCAAPRPRRRPGSNDQLIVIKFGGTSLANPARIRRAARRVRRLWQAGHPVVAVVSAAGHTTDRILARAEAAFRGGEAGRAGIDRELDRALATGEDLSAALLAGTLLSEGVPAVSLRGGEAGIFAAGAHGAGEPVALRDARIRALLDGGQVPVVAGYQAIGADGETRTLGRGGSDLTAVFLAIGLQAAECQIVTDVEGVYSADPRCDSSAVFLPELDHASLVDLTRAGAVVVHPEAAVRAGASAVPLRVFHHRAPLAAPGGTTVRATGRTAP